MAWSGLVRVEMPHAVFGLVVTNGVVTDAAPISKQSIGKPIRTVASYYRGRGGVVEVVETINA